MRHSIQIPPRSTLLLAPLSLNGRNYIPRMDHGGPTDRHAIFHALSAREEQIDGGRGGAAVTFAPVALQD